MTCGGVFVLSSGHDLEIAKYQAEEELLVKHKR